MVRRIGRRATLAAAGVALMRPALAQPPSVLRFVPHANLANLDPVWGGGYVVRNAAALVWDTLYGVDASSTPRPQMVEAHEVSGDGLTWTFRLRSGLRFHDGEKVLARDAVASIDRVSRRDQIGQIMRTRLNAIETIDDRSFRIRLNTPFPQMLFAMGKPSVPWFVMPERLARTDPFQQIGEYVGSGPMRLVRDEWMPGSRAVFARFDGYVPREEAASWWAGGKRMHFDRIEWIGMPDPSTAAAALQTGEVDWWETPLPDLLPVLRRNRAISVDIADPLGNIGILRMNHLHPPFSDVRARRALQMALSQEDYMRAVAGDDPALWRVLPSFFPPGTPVFSDAGGDVLTGPRDLAAARRLLAEAGYRGEPITVIVGAEIPANNAMGQVTADLLRRLGMNVDYVATDWGTVGQRRANKAPPAQGGWHILHTWSAGSETLFPPAYGPLRTHGDGAWFGWPRSEEIERLLAGWLDAATPEAARRATDAVNRASMEFVTQIPLGQFFNVQAWRSGIEGIVPGPLPFFWDVRKV